MSSFGAVPLDFNEGSIDLLITSANKCIQGVPGFSVVIINKETLESAKHSRTLSLDLYQQWVGLEQNGQFRFTPPTHTLLAFDQALRELKQEGGVLGRAARYKNNFEILLSGMLKLQFEPFLKPELRAYIINAFLYPKNPNWGFEKFYTKLSERGFIIYPGKLSEAQCFRIGNIGHLFEDDMQNLLKAIAEVKKEMDF